MATSFSSLYDDYLSRQRPTPAPLDPWNFAPQTASLPVGTRAEPIGGTGSLTQMPNTQLPTGLPGTTQPGVDNSVRQGAWSLPGMGPLGQFGFPTPPTAQTPGGASAPPLTPNDFGYWSGQSFENVSNWANVMGPLMQMLQNSYQWGNEYNEGQRRYDAEFGRNQVNDQFQQQFSQRQQAFQENEADRGQVNFENQFAWQQVNDQVAQDVALRQQGVNEQRFGLEQQAQNWMQQYQQQLIENERQRIEAELTAARYNAFGRGRAPVAWRGNWR